MIEEPEDKQLAAAIAASLQDENLKDWSESIDDSSEDKEDDDEIESFEYSDDESCTSKDKPARLEDKASINNEINQCTKRFKANSLDKKISSTTTCRVIEEGEDESKLGGMNHCLFDLISLGAAHKSILLCKTSNGRLGGGGETRRVQNICIIEISSREFSARNLILQPSFAVYFVSAKEFQQQ